MTRLTNKRDWKQLKITRGALVLVVVQLVVTVGYLLVPSQQATLRECLVASPRSLFEH